MTNFSGPNTKTLKSEVLLEWSQNMISTDKGVRPSLPVTAGHCLWEVPLNYHFDFGTFPSLSVSKFSF